MMQSNPFSNLIDEETKYPQLFLYSKKDLLIPYQVSILNIANKGWRYNNIFVLCRMLRNLQNTVNGMEFKCVWSVSKRQSMWSSIQLNQRFMLPQLANSLIVVLMVTWIMNQTKRLIRLSITNIKWFSDYKICYLRHIIKYC